MSRRLLSAAFFCVGTLVAKAQDTLPFRQKVQHAIQVTLDDVNHVLRGQASFVYENRSPRTLDTLWINLWPKAYRNSKTGLAEQLTDRRNEKLRMRPGRYGGNMDSVQFTVDGKSTAWGYHPQHKDLAYVVLAKPLATGENCIVSTPFATEIPDAGVSRFGHKAHDYYMVHWYPEPAVYDAAGWHLIPFTDQGHLYGEFGSFDVQITLPASYVVASTGVLQNREEKMFLQRRIEQTADFKRQGLKEGTFENRPGLKTVRYTAENVRDFAFVASRDFWVEHDTLHTPQGKTVDVYAFYRPQYQKLWKPGVSYMKKAMSFFSQTIGEYPYTQYSVTDGVKYAGVDESYGMLSVIGYKRTRLDLEDIIANTAANAWFTAALGPNEAHAPWMGEGLRAYYFRRYVRYAKPGHNGLPIPVLPVFGLRYLERNDLDYMPYLYKVRRGNDQAPGLSAHEYPWGNYGIEVRGHMAMLYRYLEDYLGTARFDTVIHDYYNRYLFAKPVPADFRNHMESATGKDLSWFFDELLYQKAYLDYEIREVAKFENPATGKKEIGVRIENKGTVAAPFPVSVFRNEKTVTAVHWQEGFLGEKIIFLPVEKNVTVQIDREQTTPDINRKNNTYNTASRSPRLEKLGINFVMGPEVTSRTQVFYTPVPLWNNYNKSMLGLAVHNKTPIRKKFEYMVVPFMSLNPISWAAVANVSGLIPTRRSKHVESVAYKFSYTRLAYFFDTKARNWDRVMPKFMVNFRPPHPRSERKMQLYVRSILNHLEATDDMRSAFQVNGLLYNVNEIGFSLRDYRLVHPYQLQVTLEYIVELNKFPGHSAGQTGKLSAEFRQKVSYISANKGFDIRLFAGTFLGNPHTALDYRYRMSGHPGYWDYKFDNYFLGRAETRGLSSRQFYENDGGFKVLVPLGQTNRWMAAVNLKASLPGPILVKPFIDMAAYRQIVTVAGTGEQVKSIQFSYSGGVMVSVINDVLEVYFPFFHSKDIRDYLALSGTPKFWQNIRFRLNIMELNPKRIREKLEWLPR